MVLPGIHKVYMLYLLKHFSFLFIILINNNCLSQGVISLFYKDSVGLYLKEKKITENKIIPQEFSDAVNIALMYYPELSKTKIKLRIKKQLAPLSARPAVWSIFLKPAKRKYIITISNATTHQLSAILLKNLSFNAQVGVIGHELAHVSEYNSKRSIFFIFLAARHLNKNSMDRFEYNTDKRCIEHGLGFQLLSWSEEVRTKLHLNLWGGANNPTRKNERYMNPETIKTAIKSLAIYN